MLYKSGLNPDYFWFKFQVLRHLRVQRDQLRSGQELRLRPKLQRGQLLSQQLRHGMRNPAN
jgi:hypothetical protein